MDTQPDFPQPPVSAPPSVPLVKDDILDIIREYNRSSGFTDRKLTDTPTDALAIVNRRYVTLNGPTASRPTASVIGQRYFDTTLNKPVWYGNSGWVDATGSSA
jgi:hypothetical protein